MEATQPEGSLPDVWQSDTEVTEEVVVSTPPKQKKRKATSPVPKRSKVAKKDFINCIYNFFSTLEILFNLTDFNFESCLKRLAPGLLAKLPTDLHSTGIELIKIFKKLRFQFPISSNELSALIAEDISSLTCLRTETIEDTVTQFMKCLKNLCCLSPPDETDSLSSTLNTLEPQASTSTFGTTAHTPTSRADAFGSEISFLELGGITEQDELKIIQDNMSKMYCTTFTRNEKGVSESSYNRGKRQFFMICTIYKVQDIEKRPRQDWWKVKTKEVKFAFDQQEAQINPCVRSIQNLFTQIHTEEDRQKANGVDVLRKVNHREYRK